MRNCESSSKGIANNTVSLDQSLLGDVPLISKSDLIDDEILLANRKQCYGGRFEQIIEMIDSGELCSFIGFHHIFFRNSSSYLDIFFKRIIFSYPEELFETTDPSLYRSFNLIKIDTISEKNKGCVKLITYLCRDHSFSSASVSLKDAFDNSLINIERTLRNFDYNPFDNVSSENKLKEYIDNLANLIINYYNSMFNVHSLN